MHLSEARHDLCTAVAAEPQHGDVVAQHPKAAIQERGKRRRLARPRQAADEDSVTVGHGGVRVQDEQASLTQDRGKDACTELDGEHRVFGLGVAFEHDSVPVADQKTTAPAAASAQERPGGDIEPGLTDDRRPQAGGHDPLLDDDVHARLRVGRRQVCARERDLDRQPVGPVPVCLDRSRPAPGHSHTVPAATEPPGTGT